MNDLISQAVREDCGGKGNLPHYAPVHFRDQKEGQCLYRMERLDDVLLRVIADLQGL